MATEYKVASNLNLYGNDVNKVQNITGKAGLVISGEGDVTVKGSQNNDDLKISSASGASISTITNESISTETPELTQTSANFKVQAAAAADASVIKVETSGVTVGKKTGNTVVVNDKGVSVDSNIKTNISAADISISTKNNNLSITATDKESTVAANNLNADTSVKIGNFRMEWDNATGTLVFVGEE